MAKVAILTLVLPALAAAASLGSVPRYHVLGIALRGPTLGLADSPARDVSLAMTFRHESGGPTITVHGFWDGDGRGGASGDVFEVRFCPTREGTWRVVKTESNHPKLNGQHEGAVLECTPSKHDGFWLPDGRWYRRSGGRHPYIVGNTHYTFLSRRSRTGAVAIDPVESIRRGRRFYNKLRFTPGGGRYVDPRAKPFLDDEGKPTDHGRFSFRPNPAWFRGRMDPVVAEGHRVDMICDIIACGPDTTEIRSALKGDPEPWLRYLAARYGSYPNVWFCLCNEWNIKNPKYTAAEIVSAGKTLRKHLPYPTPVSVHGNTGNWTRELNGDWHDHTIIQWKLKRLPQAADAAARNFFVGGRKPVLNDENAYEGRGDRFSEADVIEGCFGTFLGGGYPTTGEKYGSKLGQYFWGGFDADAHKASDNLLCLRGYIDEHIEFWRLSPLALGKSPFAGAHADFRLLAEEGREYVLGSNRRVEGIRVKLPEGTWRVAQLDLFTKKAKVIAERATGSFTFDTPSSRAALTHFRRLP